MRVPDGVPMFSVWHVQLMLVFSGMKPLGLQLAVGATGTTVKRNKGLWAMHVQLRLVFSGMKALELQLVEGATNCYSDRKQVILNVARSTNFAVEDVSL